MQVEGGRLGPSRTCRVDPAEAGKAGADDLRPAIAVRVSLPTPYTAAGGLLEEEALGVSRWLLRAAGANFHVPRRRARSSGVSGLELRDRPERHVLIAGRRLALNGDDAGAFEAARSLGVGRDRRLCRRQGPALWAPAPARALTRGRLAVTVYSVSSARRVSSATRKAQAQHDRVDEGWALSDRRADGRAAPPASR